MKLLLVLALGLVLAHAATTGKRDSKVLILGAGMAGISAGRTLQKAGIDDFIILEGTDRVGGRVKKFDFHGTNVELGANWIHGFIPDNPLTPLAKQEKMIGLKTDYDDYTMRDNEGGDLTDVADNLFVKLDEVFELMEPMAHEMIRNKSADMSVRAALRKFGWVPRSAVAKVIEYLYIEWDLAQMAEEASLVELFPLTSRDFGPFDFFIADPRGYEHLINVMADEFLEENDPRLQLEQNVVTINRDGNGVTVKTSDGNVYTADYAIVTFSIGVLQSDNVKFAPALPAWKSDIINRMNMGTYTKIFMWFDDSVTPYWDNTELFYYASRAEGRGYYPIWQNVDKLVPGSNILLVTVTGDEADRISRLSKEALLAEMTAVLRNMYGDDKPGPVDVVVPDWHTNPFFLGAYSNPSLGITPDSYKSLPAPVGRVHFAGEAMLEDSGYLHGSLISGADTAKKIMSFMEDPSLDVPFVPIAARKGCTYSLARNHDITALFDDGTCKFAAACA